jgi:signal transduction histidine kinase
LGLAIVKQATLVHGGSVSAENHPEGGLLVRLEFPTVSSRASNDGEPRLCA